MMKQIFKNKKILLIVFLLFIIFGFLFASEAKGLEINWPVAPGGKELTDNSNLLDFVDYTYRWGVLLGGLAAFIALIIAGFQYLTSVGDPSKMRGARNRIVSAILGLVLILSSFIILNTLNPDLTTLTTPTTDISGLGIGTWTSPEWDKPCEWVKLYTEKGYQGNSIDIPNVNAAIGDCIDTGAGWWIFESYQIPIKSAKVKGACQVNLYEEGGCHGSFSALAKSHSNFEWLSQDHIYSVKVVDISPPKPPQVKTLAITPNSLHRTLGEKTWEVKFNGQVTDMGRADIARGSFEYGTNELYLEKTTPPKADDFAEIFNSGPGPGDFTTSAPTTGLATNTTYYWRAVAGNEAGTDLGAISTFTTGI